MAAGPAYQPIPNSVAILPLLTSIGTAHERSIADTLYAALESGLDQSAELILMDLRNLKDQPGNQAEFGRSVKAAALLTGQILQAGGGTRIRMNLINTGQGGVAWSQEIDWDPTRIADTGTAIANGVLEALAVPASPEGVAVAGALVGVHHDAAAVALAHGIRAQHGALATEFQPLSRPRELQREDRIAPHQRAGRCGIDPERCPGHPGARADALAGDRLAGQLHL